MTPVTLRPVRLEDTPAINELRRLPGVREFTLALPSERLSHNRRFIENAGPDDHLLVAEAEGRVVGLVGLHVGQGKKRHTGTLGIMVHDAFTGKGVGTALLKAILALADEDLGLYRVDLEVAAPNARAIKLYERLGFEVEGRKRGAVLHRGEPADILIMGRLRSGQR
ncbi:MAG TPA: GNAT family protein [Candidatus Thermoplasmatota archaeon]|nr:GNAT family protein [Candidatus Thermoplasmatota archaeon]